nr:hypothetical protein BaRGS_007406 [Batillaria attramentaria]
MPFKWRLRKTRSYEISSKNSFIVGVYLLDNSFLECTLNSDSTGQECLDSIAQRIELAETCYFGLRFVTKKLQFHWVDLERPLKRQLDKHAQPSAHPHCLYFGVMFYVAGAHKISDDVARSHYYLQLKNDIIDGRLPCSKEQAIRLAAFSLQEIARLTQNKKIFEIDTPKSSVQFQMTVTAEDYYRQSQQSLDSVMSDVQQQLHQQQLQHSQGDIVINGNVYTVASPAQQGAPTPAPQETPQTIGNSQVYSHPEGISYSQPEIRQANLQPVFVEEGNYVNAAAIRSYNHNIYANVFNDGHNYYALRGGVGSGGERGTNLAVHTTYSSPELNVQPPQADFPSVTAGETIMTTESLTYHFRPPPPYPRTSSSTPDLAIQAMGVPPASDQPDLVSSQPALSAGSLGVGGGQVHSDQSVESVPEVAAMPAVSQNVPVTAESGLPEVVNMPLAHLQVVDASGDQEDTSSEHSYATFHAKESDESSDDMHRDIRRDSKTQIQIRMLGPKEAPPQSKTKEVATLRESFRRMMIARSAEQKDDSHQENMAESGSETEVTVTKTEQTEDTQSEKEGGEGGEQEPDVDYASDSDSEKVFAEFEEIPKKAPSLECNVAKAPHNQPRNRFKDVLPYDATRVKLTARKDNPDGYINASHVKLSAANTEWWFVATQAPLPDTTVDFWQMVWEQEVDVIAMLTAFQFEVELQFMHDSLCYLTSGIMVRHMPSRKEKMVWHLQYTDWPDHGCPEDTYGFLGFLDEVESVSRLAESEEGSGKKSPVSVDLPKALTGIRNQRMHMVQTLGQYQFIHDTLIQYLKNTRLI